ncbi:MAG: hypothetical protein ACJAWV_003172 [Flammeovirgaceae bacterium]|jgi:hypothetical protein
MATASAVRFQKTLPKVGVKAVQRLAGPTDSADGRTTAIHFCLAL